MLSESMNLSGCVPELFHYTKGEGLHGILISQRLWATHAPHLNDSTEIRHFFDSRLPELLGPLDAERAGALCDALRETTLRFNSVYISSFCAPADEHARRHGLLSQWRGYASEGGYAIVFDTAKLEQAVVREKSAHHYSFVDLEPVIYYGGQNLARGNEPHAVHHAELHEKVLLEEAAK